MRKDALIFAVALTLGFGGVAGCGKLRELRELRDSMGHPAVPAGYGAGIVDVDDPPDDRPPVVERDTGVVVGGDAGGGDTGGFFPVEDTDAMGPSFEEPPFIFEAWPAFGSTAGGTLVTVDGDRFTPDAEVLLGGVRIGRVDFVDRYEILFWTEAMPAGTVDLKITTPAGTAMAEGAFTFVDDLRIFGVEPARGAIAGGAPVVVSGTGFTPQTRVSFGDREARVDRFVSAEEMEVIAPPGPRRGAVDVAVFQDGFSQLPDAYAYYEEPELRRMIPALGAPTGGEEIRLDGHGIDDDCEVWFRSSTASVHRRSDGWPAVLTPGGAPGPVDVSIDCGARGAHYTPAAFTYVSDDGLSLVEVWPAVGFSRGGDVVTISGFGLADADAITFDDQELAVIESGTHHLDVLTEPSAPGTVDVTVSAGADSTTLADGFTFLATPDFASVAPDSGPTEGDWEATLFGSHLDGAERVRVDGREAPIVGRSADAIVFTVPPGEPGPARIGVSIGAIDVDTGHRISYQRPLRFDGFWPLSGSSTGGTIVYVSGDGFSSDCLVTLDGEPTATEARGTTLLAAITPPHAPGAAQLEVVGCGPRWVPSRSFQYIDPTRRPGGVGGGHIAGEISVSVIESSSGMPIAGATVMVGVRDDTPHVGYTDEFGLIGFSGPDLFGPQTVTAFAPERSTESIVGVDARRVTLVLNQILPPPCDPATDPDCVPPPPPPTGEIIGFLTGLRKITDPPPGAVLAARVETTRYSPGYPNPDPGPEAYLYADGPFRIVTRLGEMAVVAYCGWEMVETGAFTPLRMGVTRGVFIREGDEAFRTAVDCDIRLSESATFKLVDAPALVVPEEPDVGGPPGSVETYPGFYQAQVNLELGAEGHIESLPPVVADTALFSGGAFPPLEGPLDGVLLDIVAGAYDTRANLPYTASFVRRRSSYAGVISFPSLLPVPALVQPRELDPHFTDAYAEWTVDGRTRVPDFYQLSVSSGAEGFTRWSVFVPGYERSLNLADFPAFTEALGAIARPSEADRFVTFFIRAIDAEVFDYDDFDRYVLRARGWRSVSMSYQTVPLGTP